MIDVINGTDIVLKIQRYANPDAPTPPTDDPNPIAIFCSTSCTLNINTETVSASCKDNGSWAQNVDGVKSWDVSVDGLYQVGTEISFVDLTDVMIGDEYLNEVDVLIGQDGTGETFWAGKAVISSASLTAPDGEIATWSVTLVGNGALGKQVAP